MADRLLTVQDLSTHFFTHAGVVKAVNGVSFTLDRNETIGIVGESGSGKTVAAMSLMRLIPDPPGKVVEGSLMLGEKNLRTIDDDEMRAVRGNDIAMIFQDPMTSLNPVMKVGKQIAEAVMLHQHKGKTEAWQMAADLLARVGIPDADKRINQYPFEFSGGMRQRVMIAMAISCNPDVLIADEPTTALDVTIQAQIIDVVREMQAQFDSGVILITHDLGVIAEISDKVMVMYGGRTVEYGPVDEIFYNAHHPYTWGLLASVPRMDRVRTERLLPIQGSPPSLINVPPGCAFHPRCPYADLTDGLSRTEVPLLQETARHHLVACHLDAARRREIWADEIAPRL